MDAHRKFKGETWQEKINVRDFIHENYKEYDGDDSFLAEATDRTNELMGIVNKALKAEQTNGGVLSVDVEKIITLTSHNAGYINSDLELIVGLQTDELLKRGVNPFGGMRMARGAAESYGYTLSDSIEEQFKYKSTHNDGVFSAYTPEMRLARKVGLITGLPDAYGRGRIIGDYRRVALYGVDRLIADKKNDKLVLGEAELGQDQIRQLEELNKQIIFLDDLKKMALTYGCDISVPATNAQEAIQWTYFGYLGAIKEQNGAAMSLGRVSTFFDIYIERDIEEGVLTESTAQELIDQFVMKLRVARHLRTPEYNDLFGGDPMWITEVIGGLTKDGKKSLVSKSSFRMLHTLINLGSAPEPNLTILWSEKLPRGFKEFCAKISILTDSIQYENDDIMRPEYGDDYGIACCVSAMEIGKQMQFFGARCNLPKLLLLALNGGKEEKKGLCMGPQMDAVKDGVLVYDDVMARFEEYMVWLAKLYVNTMNIIHFMHDKYAYEATQLALHDTEIKRMMAFGVAGLSVIADSLSAIKYAKVTPIKNEEGIIADFEIDGDFPTFGNDDDRVDLIAKELVEKFIAELRKHHTYRDSIHTLSVLTITSNVVYGKKTGSTPDGRKAGEAFAPGANPMHNREKNGAIAALNSVAKVPYDACRDGVSNTFSIVPASLGADQVEQTHHLVDMLDGYFLQKAHHLNVNVLNKEKLMDAYDNPEKYPNLTIRVSGYAVNFYRLSREQQKEVIQRTFHTTL
ncbi:MAG: formate C-acetyltransferase [Anaerorhabdus sp.]